MTSPFNWKAEPSQLLPQLVREERRSKPADGTGWKAAGNKLLGLSHKSDEQLRIWAAEKAAPK